MNEQLNVISHVMTTSEMAQVLGLCRGSDTNIPSLLRQPLCFLGLEIEPNKSGNRDLGVPAKDESRGT